MSDAESMSDYPLHAEDLAYYDGFLSGLVPVKVLRFYYSPDEPRTQMMADVKVTADRKAYDRGDVLHAVLAGKVLHRRQVYTRSGHYRIRGQAQHKLSEGMPRHSDGTLDQRYTVKTEGTGHRTRTWVARFCGEWIGCSATKAGAEKLAREHTL